MVSNVECIRRSAEEILGTSRGGRGKMIEKVTECVGCIYPSY